MFKIILFLSYLAISDEIQFGEISFQVVEKGKSNRHYIWLHGDEKTAKMALNDHMHRNEGKAFLIQNETREVIVADGFEKDALKILKKKKNLRLIDSYNLIFENADVTHTTIFVPYF